MAHLTDRQQGSFHHIQFVFPSRGKICSKHGSSLHRSPFFITKNTTINGFVVFANLSIKTTNYCTSFSKTARQCTHQTVQSVTVVGIFMIPPHKRIREVMLKAYQKLTSRSATGDLVLQATGSTSMLNGL